MKLSEIKQKLESKSRDELNIIAKKLKIKNHRKQKIGDLISTILNKDTKFVTSILHVTWWDKNHNHIYGIIGIIGTLLALFAFWPSIFSNDDLINAQLSDSDLVAKSTIALEGNLIETYLFDDTYNLNLVLQNESEYNWHNINLDIFTMYFINEEPCLSLDKGPFVHKLTKNISFLGRAESSEINISLLGDYYLHRELNNVVVDGITVRDGLINPFLFSKTFNNEETIIKYRVEPKKYESNLFNLALYDILKQASFLPLIFQLMRNKDSKYGGFVDFVVITGQLRGTQRDYKFLKTFPIINMWYSNERIIQYAHNFLLINSACGTPSEYLVEQDTLIPLKSQTTLLNTTIKEDQIRRRIESEKRIAIEFSQIELGSKKNLELFHVNGVVLSSPEERNFKSLKTVKFKTEVIFPGFVPLPGDIKLKPCN